MIIIGVVVFAIASGVHKRTFSDPFSGLHNIIIVTSNAIRWHENVLTMPAGSHHSTGLIHITLLTLVYLEKETSESQFLLSLCFYFTFTMNI